MIPFNQKPIRTLFYTALLSLAFAACDVRNKDTEATSVAVPTSPGDVTTVEIIDSVHNFGKVTEGDIVEFNFRFKNTGNKPLVVSNVAASCGCTVPEKPEQPIRPGETGSIKAKFNTDKRPGEAVKTVTVTSNANPSFPELILKGTVVAKQTTSN